jgi:hypothetical protein
MASKPVVLHPDAELEYLTSLGWYRDRSFTAAEDFEEEFDCAITSIREAPERWPSYLKRAGDIFCTNFHSALYFEFSPLTF